MATGSGGRGHLKLVVDSNVWIHLCHAGLLNEATALPYELVSPDAVVGELEDPAGHNLVVGRARVASLSPSGIARVWTLAQRYAGPSPADLAALVVAEDEQCALVTGDNSLRKAAEAEGVTVRGVLWVLDELVAEAAVTPARAAEGLRAMLAQGARLPGDECRRRLGAWERA